MSWPTQVQPQNKNCTQTINTLVAYTISHPRIFSHLISDHQFSQIPQLVNEGGTCARKGRAGWGEAEEEQKNGGWKEKKEKLKHNTGKKTANTNRKQSGRCKKNTISYFNAHHTSSLRQVESVEEGLVRIGQYHSQAKDYQQQVDREWCLISNHAVVQEFSSFLSSREKSSESQVSTVFINHSFQSNHPVFTRRGSIFHRYWHQQ